MVNFYWKASIISNLSVNLPAIPFRSTSAFLNTPYQVTLIKDSSYQEFFEKSETDPFKTAWETKFQDKDKSLKGSLEEMIPLIQTGKYAMFDTYSVLLTLQEYKDCKITDSGFYVNTMSFAFTLQKNSQYTELFNTGMKKMLEHGTLQRILVKNQPSRPSCDDKKKGVALGLPNIAFAFFILLFGAAVGTVLFLLEQVRNQVIRILLGLIVIVCAAYLATQYYSLDSK